MAYGNNKPSKLITTISSELKSFKGLQALGFVGVLALVTLHSVALAQPVPLPHTAQEAAPSAWAPTPASPPSVPQTPFWFDQKTSILKFELDQFLVPTGRGRSASAFAAPIVLRRTTPQPVLLLRFPNTKLKSTLAATAFQLATGSVGFGTLQLKDTLQGNKPVAEVSIPMNSEALLNKTLLLPSNDARELRLQLPKSVLSGASEQASRWLKDIKNVVKTEVETAAGKVTGANTSAPVPVMGEGDRPNNPSTSPATLANLATLANIQLEGETLVLNTLNGAPLTLQKQSVVENPRRLVFDFAPARLQDKQQTLNVPNVSSRMKSVRVGQFSDDTVRVVVETNEPESFRLAYGPAGSGQSAMMPLPYKAGSGLNWLQQGRWVFRQQAPVNGSIASPLAATTLQGVSAVQQSNGQLFVSLGSGSATPLDYLVHQNGKNTVVELFNVPPPQEPVYFDATQLPGLRQLLHQASPLTGPSGSRLLLEGKDTLLGLVLRPNVSQTQLLLQFKGASAGGAMTPPVVEERRPVVPRNGKPLIVVDAGHGGKDQGASRNGVLEKDLNLAVALKLRAALEARGYQVMMTRNNDSFVPLPEISGFSNQQNPDVFVSVHHNSSNSPSLYGLETYYYKADSKRLATAVHGRLVQALPVKDNGVRTAMFYVVNHTRAPAVLCEIGYVSNAAEQNRLTDAASQQKAASAIAQGVADFLEGR
jgi:N-acetylmuramoyl-L-alanine amidase